MELTFIAAIAGLVFGFIGTCLGIFNTWKAGQKDKVQLKIIPKIYQNRPNGRLSSSRIPTDLNERWDGLCVEIANVGFLSVTVDEIGLQIDSEQRVVFRPELSGGEFLPKRLEPRTSISCFIPSKMPNAILQEGLPFAKSFYATTACGITVQGSSKVAKWLIAKGRKSGVTKFS